MNLDKRFPNKITRMKAKKLIDDHISNKRTTPLKLYNGFSLFCRDDYDYYITKTDSGIIFTPYIKSLAIKTVDELQSVDRIEVKSRYATVKDSLGKMYKRVALKDMIDESDN